MTVPPDLAALPKAEVHVHLEGTVRPATLEELCARTGLSVPRVFTDLPSFVEVYSCAWATMTTPGDYARLVREYCEDVARGGVRYAGLEPAAGGRPRLDPKRARRARRRAHPARGAGGRGPGPPGGARGAADSPRRLPHLEPAPGRRAFARRAPAPPALGRGRHRVGQHRRSGLLRKRPGLGVRDRRPPPRPRPARLRAPRRQLGGRLLRARGPLGRAARHDSR